MYRRYSGFQCITPSGGFSGEIKFDRSIPIIEDWISRLLHYFYRGMLQEG